MTAIKAVHRAVSHAGALVVVAGPTERQSAEFLRKVKDFLRTMNLRVRGDGHNRVSVELPNGSRIIGLPGNCEGNIRGFSAVSLLIIDEAARVDESLYRCSASDVDRGQWGCLAVEYSEWETGIFS